MLPLRHVRRWRLAGLVLLLLVLAATMMPAVWLWPQRREFVAWFINADKWLHAITFVFLAVWFSGQYRRESYWRVGLGLIFFGVLIEVCQRMVTYRSSEMVRHRGRRGRDPRGACVSDCGPWRLESAVRTLAGGQTSWCEY